VILHLVRQHLLLRLVTMFEKLLNHVIAEHIRHQLYGIRMYFPEDLLLFIAISGLKFLLNESGAVLIATEFNNMVIDVLNFLVDACVPVGFKAYLELISLICFTIIPEFLEQWTSQVLAWILLSGGTSWDRWTVHNVGSRSQRIIRSKWIHP